MHSFPSHYTIEVDVNDLVQTHPGDDWIRFQPEIHRTSIKIPATEAEPMTKVDARFIRFQPRHRHGGAHYLRDYGSGTTCLCGSLGGRPCILGSTSRLPRRPTFHPINGGKDDRRTNGESDRRLGRLRVKADIIRLRNLEADRRKLAFCLKEVQALEAYTQKRRAEFGIHQLAHVGRLRRYAKDSSGPMHGDDFWSWWTKITRGGNWHGDTDETGTTWRLTVGRPGPTPG
jgi:hypothetical protein